MKKIIIGVLFSAPMVALATVSGPLGNTLNSIRNVVNFIIPLLLSVAVLLFFWGLVKYIANASDEAAKEGGKTLMIWGMIAIFVMVAFWGIIGYVQSSLGLTGSIAPATSGTIDVTPTVQ